MNALLAVVCTVLVVVIIDFCYRIQDLKDSSARNALRKKAYRAMRVNFAIKKGVA